MKVSRIAATALMCGLLCLVSAAVWAQTSGHQHQNYTSAQIQASNQTMGQAVSQLQTALSDLQSSSPNKKVCAEALRTAEQTMKSALPIYHGKREQAMKDVHAAHEAVRANNPSGAIGSVQSAIGLAQQCAQGA